MDMCLAFIDDVSGKAEAGKVQLLLEYFPTTINYVDLKQVKDLPPITSPGGSIESGTQKLPQYVLEEYF